jgi:hypothetical protein
VDAHQLALRRRSFAISQFRVSRAGTRRARQLSEHMPHTHRTAAQLRSRMWQATLLVLVFTGIANGQGSTKALGVGAAIGSLWKADIQMPIPEKVEATISMQPTTVYKATMELHTKGFCVPRQAWQLQVSLPWHQP